MEEKEIRETIDDGAYYVEQYLRLARGRTLGLEQIKEVLDIYHDFLLLDDWGKCCNG